MAKSLDKALADAAAISARNTADRHPDNARMQEIAKQIERTARNTK